MPDIDNQLFAMTYCCLASAPTCSASLPKSRRHKGVGRRSRHSCIHTPTFTTNFLHILQLLENMHSACGNTQKPRHTEAINTHTHLLIHTHTHTRTHAHTQIYTRAHTYKQRTCKCNMYLSTTSGNIPATTQATPPP
jgi:hypothetical protein